MSKISKLIINTNKMPLQETTRDFSVKGKNGAKFFIIAVEDGTLKYYNFETNTFDLGHAPKSNLIITMTGETYNNSLTFPSGGGKFVIKLITLGDTIFKKNSNVISKTIEKQSGDATVTIKPATINTNNYQTFPTKTSTGAIIDSDKFEINFNILNASTDAGGHGLRYKTNIKGLEAFSDDAEVSDYLEKAFEFDSKVLTEYFFTTKTKTILTNALGDGVNSKEVFVSDASDLVTGMVLFYHKGTTTPVTSAGAAVEDVSILKIDVKKGLVAFNKEVAFEDGEIMTLRAYGPKNINVINNMGFEPAFFKVKSRVLTKTIRANSSGTTITLKDTHGVPGGNVVGYTGFGVNNSSSNLISTVTPDCPDLTDNGSLDNDGAMTVQLAQELEEGTIITILNSFVEIDITGTIIIKKYPESNLDINLDLDKFLIPGVSGS